MKTAKRRARFSRVDRLQEPAGRRRELRPEVVRRAVTVHLRGFAATVDNLRLKVT